MDIGQAAVEEEPWEWEVDAVSPNTQCYACGEYGRMSRNCPKGKGKGGNQQVTRHPLPKGGKGNKQKVGTWAAHLMNGDALCQAFNKGDCPKGKGKSRASGAHKCSKVLKGGRPCGQSNHSAKDCRSA